MTANEAVETLDDVINEIQQQARENAIRDFAERLRNESPNILIWLMKRQENGYGTTNGELHNKWLNVVDELAGQMIADMKEN